MLGKIVNLFLNYTKTFFCLAFSIVFGSVYFFISNGHKPFKDAVFTQEVIHTVENSYYNINENGLNENQLLICELIKSQTVTYKPKTSYISQCLNFKSCSLAGEILLLKEVLSNTNEQYLTENVYLKKLLRPTHVFMHIARKPFLNNINKMYSTCYFLQRRYYKSLLMIYAGCCLEV